MKQIVFNVSDVLPQIIQASSVVAAKSPLPILSDVVIKSFVDKEGKPSVVFNASDGEQWLAVKGELVSGDTGFAVAVGVHDFIKALKNLSGRVVSLEYEDGEPTVCAKYENGQFVFPADNADEFPSPAMGDDGKTEKLIDSDILLNAIVLTEIAMSNSAIRPIMSGIHFDFFADRMVSVALDHQKLSKYTNRTVTNDDGNVCFFTIPSKTARVISVILGKTDGDVKLTICDHMIVLSRSNFKLTARILEGNYPDYDRLLQSKPTKTATVSKEDILNALKRVLPLGNTTSECVSLNFTEGKLTLSTKDLDFSKSANEEISCDYQGEEFSVGVKGSVFAGLLSNVMDDNVTLLMSEETKPVMITPETQGEDSEYTGVIMPMLLDI